MAVCYQYSRKIDNRIMVTIWVNWVDHDLCRKQKEIYKGLKGSRDNAMNTMFRSRLVWEKARPVLELFHKIKQVDITGAAYKPALVVKCMKDLDRQSDLNTGRRHLNPIRQQERPGVLADDQKFLMHHVTLSLHTH